MGCGTTFVKYVLFFFNLIFALCGLLLLGIGVAAKLNYNRFTDIIDPRATQAPIWFIVIGSIIFIIAFFGCCGAVRESHCMVVTYAIFMLIIIILQVVIGILIFVYIGDVEKALKDIMHETFKQMQDNNDPVLQEAFNAMQSDFQCCGVDGPSNYGTVQIPISCCPKGFIENLLNTCTPIQAYQNGCASVMSDYIRQYGKGFAIGAIVIAVIEVVGAVFALCLANSIRNADRRYR